MAVTIHNTPQEYTPSDNPVTWTFSSDETAQANFVFLVEVYINGVLKANELVFPESGIYAHFDASAYASNACNIPVINSELMEDAANNNEINIKVIERYGDPVSDQADATSGVVTVFKARLDDDEFVDWQTEAVNYISDGLTTGLRWLSNHPTAPSRMVKQEDESQRIMAITNEDTVELSVILYDSNDAIIAQDLAISLTPSPKIAIFNVSPEIIAAETSINASDFDNCEYYTIETNFFDAETIVIDRGIVYEYYRRIHFLSEIGSIESFTFALISRPTASIKSHGYRRSWGEWDGSDFNYTKTEGRDVDFAKVSERKLIVESDWLNQDIQHWLHRNLFESPAVWEETEIGGGAKGFHLRRRKIMQTEWADNYNKNDTLFKERITLGLPHKTSMII